MHIGPPPRPLHIPEKGKGRKSDNIVLVRDLNLIKNELARTIGPYSREILERQRAFSIFV